MIVKLRENAKELTLTLDTNSSLGRGGEGRVYRIISPSKYQNTHCVKIYHTKEKAKKQESKIEFLCSNKPKYNYSFIKLCWPEKKVYNKQGFCGYLMPLAFDNSYNLFDIKPINYKDISNLPQNIKDKFDRSTPNGILNRMKLIVNIAIAYHTIHQTNKYLITDLKPDNILFNEKLYISIIDCDSFQVLNNSHVLFKATATTPDYTPPEYYTHKNILNIDKNWDYFSFGVLTYEIMYGVHPFSATFKKPYDNCNDIASKIQNKLFVHGSKKRYLSNLSKNHPHNNFKHLPKELQNLWINSLDKNTNRTSFEDFGITFTNYINKSTKNQKHKSAKISKIFTNYKNQIINNINNYFHKHLKNYNIYKKLFSKLYYFAKIVTKFVYKSIKYLLLVGFGQKR